MYVSTCSTLLLQVILRCVYDKLNTTEFVDFSIIFVYIGTDLILLFCEIMNRVDTLVLNISY